MRRRMAALLICALWILGLIGPFPTNALASVADSGTFGAEGAAAWTLRSDGTLEFSGGGMVGQPYQEYKGMKLYGVSATWKDTTANVSYDNWELAQAAAWQRMTDGVIRSPYKNHSALKPGNSYGSTAEITLASSSPFTLRLDWKHNTGSFITNVVYDFQITVGGERYLYDIRHSQSQSRSGSVRKDLPAGTHTLTLSCTLDMPPAGYATPDLSYISIEGLTAGASAPWGPWSARKDEIRRVSVPDGFTSVGDYAFSHCAGLTDAALPGSLESVGENAFDGCENLRDVYFFGAEEQWNAVKIAEGNDALKSAQIHYAEGGDIGEGLSWTLENGRLTVAGSGDMPDWDADAAPPWSLFRGYIDTVVIRRGVSGIGNRAFEACPNLRLASIPAGVTRIGGGAFADCPALESVSMPDGLLSVGEAAFEGCAKLKLAVLPGSVSSIGTRAFADCASLESLNFPGAASRVADGAFSGCAALSSATISEGVSEIGDNAFSGCAALSVLTLPPGLRSIGASAFANCAALAELALPDGLERIGQSAFSGCAALTALQIPASVRSIEASVFSGCAALSEVAIPTGVASVEPSAFAGCAALTTFKVLDGNSVYAPGDGALFSLDRETLFLYPPGRSGAYAVPEGVTEIAPNAFANCVALTALNLSDTVERIGDGAFRDCAALSDIYYIGTEVDWISIEVGADNAPFLSANLRYAYLIQFAPNGGSVGEQSKAVVNGAPYGALPTPQRSGCAFDGWFTAAVGGELVTADTVAELSGNQTLFAHWTATNIPELSDGDNEVTDFEQAQAAENLEGLLTVPDAETPDVFITAMAFCAVYDRDGMMVSIQAWDVDVSDVRNIRFMGRVSVPEGVSVGEIKVMVLSDGLSPLQEPGMF